MEKIDFFGELNAGKDSLKRASEKFKILWNEGQIRLPEDDVVQIEGILREIKGEAAAIKSINELFRGITNNKIKE